MKNTITKLGLTGLLAVSLTGCFGPSKEETQACLTPFETQIQLESQKHNNFSNDEKKIIETGNQYASGKKFGRHSETLGLKILNFTSNYNPDFVDRLHKSVNASLTTQKLIEESYNACVKDKGDAAMEMYDTNIYSQKEENLKTGISSAVVLGLSLKNRESTRAETKSERTQKIIQRRNILEDVHTMSLEYLDIVNGDRKALHQKLRYVSGK